jgi:hypothetical protein
MYITDDDVANISIFLFKTRDAITNDYLLEKFFKRMEPLYSVLLFPEASVNPRSRLTSRLMLKFRPSAPFAFTNTK